MKPAIRHILLTTGLVSMILSFLFFGREQDTYMLILLAGFIVSIISYLTIIIKRDSLRNKIIWTLVVASAIFIQHMTEPLLVKTSHSIFLNKHRGLLTQVNSIVAAKPGDIILTSYDEADKDKFSKEETKLISQLFKKTSISLIHKDSCKIFYRTFGLLDVSNGISNFYSTNKPTKAYRHICNSWYY